MNRPALSAPHTVQGALGPGAAKAADDCPGHARKRRPAFTE
jgi:hypothetical protein